MEGKFSPTLEELKQWAKGRKFDKEPLRLGPGVTVIDKAKFFSSHVATLEAKANSHRKKYYLPFYERLRKFYILESTKI